MNEKKRAKIILKELNKIKDISNAMETLLEESEKHNLFLPDLAEKFKEL